MPAPCALGEQLGAEWGTGGDGDATRGSVEAFEEGDEEGIEAGEQAKVAADPAEGQRAQRVMEVAERQQEEGEGEQEEDAPHGFGEAEADDPEQTSEDAPHQQDETSSGSGGRFEPAGSDGPLQQGEPPPEHAIGDEGDHSEGVARREVEDACD